MSADEAKAAAPRRCFRVASLRIKPAIAGLALLTITGIILVALASTGILSRDSDVLVPTGSLAQRTPLRIMALGASITKGEHSNGTVGFRRALRDGLALNLSVPINMVGSVRLGDLADNDVEAFGGFRISQIDGAARATVPYLLPNVFVVNVGTNNVLQKVEVANASVYMRGFVDYLLGASPRAFVVVSTLVPCLRTDDGICEEGIGEVNEQLRGLGKEWEGEGRRVVLVEMHNGTEHAPGQEVLVDKDIGPDGMHPTDSGYEMMGRIFVKGIQEADRRGWIRVPSWNASIPDDGTAERLGVPGG